MTVRRPWARRMPPIRIGNRALRLACQCNIQARISGISSGKSTIFLIGSLERGKDLFGHNPILTGEPLSCHQEVLTETTHRFFANCRLHYGPVVFVNSRAVRNRTSQHNAPDLRSGSNPAPQ